MKNLYPLWASQHVPKVQALIGILPGLAQRSADRVQSIKKER